MTECIKTAEFVFYKNRKLEADFSGGDLSSDGGILLLRQLDENLGLFVNFQAVLMMFERRPK